MSDAINIKNKKAYFEFEFIDKFIAGIQLTGTEIKSIREGKVNMNDGWCYFQKNELWIKNLNISTYDKGTHYNHEPLRPRKLLLNKKELKKLQDKIKEKG
ncbi:MAG: SsrA-binding protein, partial [Chitinophagales bacterium]|nr:SsrA-binding protein [Chitinophagales bacterium]